MATRTSSQDLANLVINRVASPAAFQQMINAGQVNENELYLVEGDTALTYAISESGGVITLTGSDGSTSTANVPTKTSDLTNDSSFITASSPALTGTPTAPTATTGTSTTQIATTAFVANAINAAIISNTYDGSVEVN